MSRGDYTRRPRNWRNDPELVALHRRSKTVPCRHCDAGVDEVCVKPDEPGRPELVNLPCHPVRVIDSTKGTKQP